ncbi:MAG: SIMPL domain-containing protein [Xenophilus sp.]
MAAAGAAAAQGVQGAPPQNVLQLSASGTVEVQQDLLSMTLAATRDGADAAAVQSQVRSALDAALAEAKKEAQPGQLDVRTGHFGLSPRYGRDGKITGWQGSAELILEGRDFDRITRTASRIGSLPVSRVGFALSREQRQQSEAEAQQAAIDNFRRKADELARGFGFSGYSLREVSVNASQGGPVPPRLRAAAPQSFPSDAPVPVEAGKAAVTVSISGSVQLQ